MRYFLPLLVIALAFTSCEYQEDELSSSDIVNQIVRFEFPEGDDPWDEKLEALTETYDVIPIYKSFTKDDLNKKWTGLSTVNYEYQDMTAEAYSSGGKSVSKAEVYTDFLVDEIFPYYVPEIANKVFPMYFYYAEDLRQNNPSELVVPYRIDGFDYWYLTFYTDTPGTAHNLSYPNDLEYPSDVEVLKKWHKGSTLNKAEKEVVRACRNTGVYMYIEKAIDRGLIVAPENFNDGVDKANSIGTDPTGNNYFLKRGFVHKVEQRTIISVSTFTFGGVEYVSKVIQWSFRTLSNITSLSRVTADYGDFKNYIRIAMRFNQEEFEAQYPPETYPLINSRYHMVVEHMRDTYGIDLQNIANGVKE